MRGEKAIADDDGNRGTGTLRAVGRALDILEALAREDLGLTALGREAGLTPSTTHRMLATLTARNYVRRDADSGRYRLGPAATGLAVGEHRSGVAIGAVAAPFMERIHRVSKHRVNLTVLFGSHIVFVDQLVRLGRAGHRRPSARPPAHASASGKAMLAFGRGDPPQCPQGELLRCTAQTIARGETLTTELAAVSRIGFAVDHQEFQVGTVCVAAPILDAAGQAIAALSVTDTAERLREDAYDDLGELVRQAAAEASATIGFDREAGPAS